MSFLMGRETFYWFDVFLFCFLCKINSAGLYIILCYCFGFHENIEINFIPKWRRQEAFKDILSLFQNHLPLNVAKFHIKAKIEKKRVRKIYPNFLLYS